MNSLILKRALLCLLVPLFTACAPMYRNSFMADAEKAGWTKEQQLDAYYVSLRMLCLKKAENEKYDVNYGCLSKEDVVRQMEKNLTDLESFLSRTNPELDSYVDVFHLRKSLERQESILKAAHARILADYNHKKFQKLIGEEETSTHYDESGHTAGVGFDRSILSIQNPREKFPFMSNIVEEAQKSGLLKEVARVRKLDMREFYRKDRDPNDPGDANKFVWVTKKVEYERVDYKAVVDGEKPLNNNPNYVEIWRLVNGKRESIPAAKAFLSGNGTAVIVLDTDKESEVGFGLPNVVAVIPENDLYGDAMIATIFPDKKNRRIEPMKPPLRAELAFAGTPFDPWEKCQGPCWVPKRDAYRSKPLETNYNIRIIFDHAAEKNKDVDLTSKRIKYISKEWYATATGGSDTVWGPGKIVEYYKPKSQCDGKIADAKVLDVTNKKKVLVTCQDGSERSGVVTSKNANMFIEDNPVMMDFTVAEKRWSVNLVEAKRRPIALNPAFEIGVYADLPDGEKSGTFEP